MRRSLTDLGIEPIYNMKAVEQQTGISAPTLRAWERRYQLVTPRRTDSGYRLYSEQDIALLRWVRRRIDEGLTVGRIAALIDGLRAAGEPIILDDTDRSFSAEPINQAAISPEALVEPLFHALIDRNEAEADQVLDRAYALYKLPTIFKDLLSPVLIEVGEAWHRGEVLISVEHFATTYVRGRLLTLFQSYPLRPGAPLILVACAPHETHELGALMLAVLLRQDNFNVTYLGQDMPLDDLILTAKQDRPAVICLSAQSMTTAEPLNVVQDRLSREIPAPVPYFVFGGYIFDQDAELRAATPGYYLGSDTRAATITLRNLINGNGAHNGSY